MFAGLAAADLEAIKEATEAAEKRTGGELVCVLVRRCDSYNDTPWKGAALGAVAGAGATTLWLLVAGWLPLPPLAPPLLTLFGAALGYLAVVALPTLRRLLVSAEELDLRVDRRASEAFLQEEIFATRDRIGVLLFVAFFEHRVRILADSGVKERVERSVWDEISGELTRGIRAGRTRDALIHAIEAAGDALAAEGGVERRADDVDELPNPPRVYDA